MGNVYLYVHDLRSSGVVRNALAFATRIARDHRTILVAGYGDGFFAAEAAAGPFELVLLGKRPRLRLPPRLAAIPRLRRWLAAQPPGVLLSAGNMGHPTAYWATRGLRHIRRIYIISNEVARDDGIASTLRCRWMAMLVADSARTILVGRALARLDLFAGALAAGRAVEIPNGVDLDRAAALARAPSPHAWLGGPVPLVLGIGRLRPQKNFDQLIAAVGDARRQTGRLRLAIIGGGSAAEQARLRALAAAAGLDEDFLLAGETDNVFAWLARADLFVLPSRWETSSLALLEALAAGVPVIAARRAGDAAIVLDQGRYGLLFDGDDAAALSAAIVAQLGPDPIRPGDRAGAYAAGVTADRHAAVVDAVLAEGG